MDYVLIVAIGWLLCSAIVFALTHDDTPDPPVLVAFRVVLVVFAPVTMIAEMAYRIGIATEWIWKRRKQ